VAIVISTVSFMVLTIEKPCHLESGPGGLSALGLISNLAVLILCAIILVLAVVFHPKGSSFGHPYVLISVIIWIGLELIVVNIPWVWGYYNLKIHVVDWHGKPLTHVRIHILEEKMGISLDQAFLNDDVETVLFTDSSGNINFEANNYRAIFGIANGYWHERANPDLGMCEFSLRPPYALTLIGDIGSNQALRIAWNSKGIHFGEPNEKDYTTSVPRPYTANLTIFLPGSNGEDVSPYPSGQ
jgi:hypothetical protein